MKGADGVCIAGVPMHIAGLKAARSLGRTRNRRQMWVVRSQRVDNEGDPSESSASRRHLLIGTGSTTGLLLSGQAAHSGTDPLSMYRTAPGGGAARKEGREAKFVMRITALRGSVPASWISDFATAMEGYGVVAMTQKPQIIDIWDELMGIKNASKKKNRDAFLTTDTNKANQTTVDAVTLGDAWLRAAIVKGLIQPIEDARDRRYWSYLSPRWRQLVCRNAAGEVDQAGKVWGIPYRWGCTVILYRRDTARRWGGAEGAVIKDWDDLLLPGLKNRVAFVDSPREFLGVAFKTLGLGYNATSSSMESCGVSELDVVARLKNLSQQMRVFSNVDHVRAFAAGEVDVIVGWSEDLLPLAERVPSAQIALPASGTALWADLWCVPTNSAGGFENGRPSPLLPAWLELGLQPTRRQRRLRGGASPLDLPGKVSTQQICMPIQIVDDEAEQMIDLESKLPPEKILLKSEFLLPLDKSTASLHLRVLNKASQ